jgi:hypothetical protein
MAKGDRRHSLKMRQRVARRKKKEREGRKAVQAKQDRQRG